MSLEDRVEELEEQVAMLTDLLAESDFRERIASVEEWIGVVEISNSMMRDRARDN